MVFEQEQRAPALSNVDASAECWVPVLSKYDLAGDLQVFGTSGGAWVFVDQAVVLPRLGFSCVFAPRAGHSRQMLNTSQYDSIGPIIGPYVIICANAGDGRACECGKL